ncbi:class F sortase [Luteipulveratus mongoliensis]|nr:class F sortase [Luteipulveratus mongoliensis]
MTTTPKSRSLRAAAGALALGVLLAGCGGSSDDASSPLGDSSTAASTPGAPSTNAQTPGATGSVPAVGEMKPDGNGTGVNGATRGATDGGAATSGKPVAGAPTRLSMPTIGFNRSLASLGVNGRGEISPPAGVAQWYNKSVKPGQTGISVIAGHVMYDGPDVFYKLDKLSVGDVVTVGFGNGAQKKFKVYDEASIDKKKLQTDARVWGTSSKPVLALITCDASSQVVGNHHVDNYVVWASPV